MNVRIPHKFIIEISQLYMWDILEYCSHYSKSLFTDDTPDINATKRFRFPDGEVLVSGWGLVDLSYYACRYASNEESSIRIINDIDFLRIYSLCDDYHNDLDGKILRKYKKKNETLLFFHCFYGEQARFQMIKPQYDTLHRTIYLINTILRDNYPEIPVDDIFEEYFCQSIDDVGTVLLSSWTSSSEHHYVLQNITNTNGYLVPERIVPVLEHYAATPDQIKDSAIERQQFYCTPIIKTADGNYLVSNIYLYIFTFLEYPYWLLRTHYMQLKSQEFTNKYGKCFEIYFKELLEEYLPEGSYEKIDEDVHEERADWKIDFGGYKVLVEQKSAIAAISSKQQIPDVENTEVFLRRHWMKAISQLYHTERHYGDSDYIKMILVSDDYFKDEVLDCVFDLEENDVNNDGRYWLVSIDMMEVLLYTYKHSPDAFQAIMDEKNQLELSHSNDGRDLYRIVKKHGIDKNYHIIQEKYTGFFNEIKNRVVTDLGET